jgi:hypothetical protein
VFEHLGFYVDWNANTQQAFLINDDYTVIITIGDNTFATNGATYNLDVPAQIIDGRTMLPIRAVLESIGYYIEWNSATSTIEISTRNPLISEEYEQLANSATNIITATVLNIRRDNISVITLRVNESFKGTLSMGDVIEMHFQDDYIANSLGILWVGLLFLQIEDDGSVNLVNDTYSMYRYNTASISVSYTNINENEQINEIFYDSLLETWENYLNELSALNPSLSYTPRVVRSGHSGVPTIAYDGYDFIRPNGDTIFGPFAIFSINDFISRRGLYRRFEEDYPEDFFEEKYLVVLNFTNLSGSMLLDVDAFLENGDIFVSRLTPAGGYTFDVADWLIILEVDREIIPEQLNLIVNSRYYFDVDGDDEDY